MCDDENVKQKFSREIRRAGGTGGRKGGGREGVGVVDMNQCKISTPMACQGPACLPRAPCPWSDSCHTVLHVTALASGTGLILQGKSQDLDIAWTCTGLLTTTRFSTAGLTPTAAGGSPQAVISPGCRLCCKGQLKH